MTAIDHSPLIAATPAAELRWGEAWRRPPARMLAAAVAAVALARYGATPDGVIAALFVAVLVLIGVIDLERRIIPNALVLPSALLVLALQIAADPGRTVELAVAALGAAACLLVLHLVKPAGMGMGDVKLAFLLGAGLGAHVVTAVVLGSLAVWPFALYVLMREGRGIRKATIAFGPYLAFGGIVVALAGGA